MNKQTYEKITELLKKKDKYNKILYCFDKHNLSAHIRFDIIGEIRREYWESSFDEEDIQYLKIYFNALLNNIEKELKELGYYE